MVTKLLKTIAINPNVPITWIVATLLSVLVGIYYAGKFEIVEKLSDQDTKSDTIKTLKDEIKTLEQDNQSNDQLSIELAKATDKVKEQEELVRLNISQLSDLRNDYNNLKSKYKSLDEELKRKSSEAGVEIKTLNSELRSKEREIESHSTTLADLRTRLNEALNDVSEKSNTISILLVERNQDCRFSRLTGTESGSWRIEWDFDSKTHRGTHPGGGSKTSSIDISCSLRFLSVRQTGSSDGNNCTYFGTISGNSVAGTYHCSSVGGNLPFSGTLTSD